MKEIRDFIEKAEKFLSTAENALNSGDYDSCVSRCYYAMFFTAQATLLTVNLNASSHKGVITLFGKHFIKTGIFEKRLGKVLNDAYDTRVVGDYGVGLVVTEQQAQDLLAEARYFVASLSRYLKNQMERENRI